MSRRPDNCQSLPTKSLLKLPSPSTRHALPPGHLMCVLFPCLGAQGPVSFPQTWAMPKTGPKHPMNVCLQPSLPSFSVQLIFFQNPRLVYPIATLGLLQSTSNSQSQRTVPPPTQLLRSSPRGILDLLSSSPSNPPASLVILPPRQIPEPAPGTSSCACPGAQATNLHSTLASAPQII